MKNALILCLGLMVGCKSESVDSLTLGSDFPLTTKQPVQVGDVQLALTGVEDSRCPKNVQCVRAGEVAVSYTHLDVYKRQVFRIWSYSS